MTKINDYLIQSELAMASYGSFLGNSVIVTDLTDLSVGMSPTQATDFVEKWQVSAQYTDPVTGLSATVFEEIATGTKHLAIRGTEPARANDIVSDLLLAAGWPSNFNPQFIALRSHLENVWLQDPAVLQGQNFTVTGHSLENYGDSLLNTLNSHSLNYGDSLLNTLNSHSLLSFAATLLRLKFTTSHCR